MLDRIRKLVPAPLLSAYHFGLAITGALVYGFPSRRMTVIAVTGTKGKSSTIEYLNAVFEEAGHVTALSSTIRQKIAGEEHANSGRSTPGRFALQKFLQTAVRANCSVAILEMTSEGARQHRHRGIALDCVVFLNLAPEHIESHGSLQAYADAKYSLALALTRTHKRPRVIIANADDTEGARYLALHVEKKHGFSLTHHEPWHADEHGGQFVFEGETIDVRLPGEFSLKNALAAAETARAFGVDTAAIKRGIASVVRIPGRAEEIREGQLFTVVVDYAHTPDSLTALYSAYKNVPKICVVSATGGGRDTWKRPVMGKVADAFCERVIVTDEDPYDEDPRAIMEAVARGMARVPEIIDDRRAAIARALALARPGDAVLISGKGTDAYIHGAHGKNVPWSDAQVVREELKKLTKR